MEAIEKSRGWLKPKVTWLRDSWREVRHHVTWPSKEEVAGTTRVVLFAVVVFAIIVGTMDVAIYEVLQLIFKAAA